MVRDSFQWQPASLWGLRDMNNRTCVAVDPKPKLSSQNVRINNWGKDIDLSYGIESTMISSKATCVLGKTQFYLLQQLKAELKRPAGRSPKPRPLSLPWTVETRKTQRRLRIQVKNSLRCKRKIFMIWHCGAVWTKDLKCLQLVRSSV